MNKTGLMRGLLLFFFMLFFVTAGAVEKLHVFQTEQQEGLYRDLTETLRCLVCQNQSLADSEASLAKDLKQEIYLKVSEGQSKEQILSYMTFRYGDFILYQPPVNKRTYLLWGFPGMLLILAVLGFFYFIFGRKK